MSKQYGYCEIGVTGYEYNGRGRYIWHTDDGEKWSRSYPPTPVPSLDGVEFPVEPSGEGLRGQDNQPYASPGDLDLEAIIAMIIILAVMAGSGAGVICLVSILGL